MAKKPVIPNLPPWEYRGVILQEPPTDAFGFIYRIQYLGSKSNQIQYIGKKQFALKTSRKAPAKQQLTVKGKPRKKIVRIKSTRKSDWETYTGSCDELNILFQTEPPHLFRRQILEFANTKLQLNYLEDKYLFCEGVLENPLYFNRNIGGRYYKKHLYPEVDHGI